MSDFFPGILSKFLCFHIFNGFARIFLTLFLPYSLANLPEGVDKAADPALSRSFLAGERSFLVGHLLGSASAVGQSWREGVVFGGTGTPASARPPERAGRLAHLLHLHASRFLVTRHANSFLGPPARGGNELPLAFTTRLAQAQLCCQVNSGAISCRQEKILQFPPPISYRQESVCGMAEDGDKSSRWRGDSTDTSMGMAVYGQCDLCRR